jgi:DNA-binding CsgD family transcriptional regulator
MSSVGLGVVAEQMLPSDEFGKTEFYNDFYRKSVGRTAVGVTIVREQGRSFLLSTATSRADPNENMAAAERLTKLSPHLGRAFRHYQAGSRQKAMAEVGSSLFDAINVGLVIVGEGASIKSISASGQKMIEFGSGVRLTPLGRIKICSPEADAALHHMLDRSSQGHKVLSFAFDRSKLTFIRIRKDRFSAFFEGPTVIILMEPFHGNRYSDIRHFVQAYRLTKAEARALAGIVDGKSVNEMADEAMRSRETIRSQMKSLYAKTGVSSQTKLLRLVGRSSVD